VCACVQGGAGRSRSVLPMQPVSLVDEWVGAAVRDGWRMILLYGLGQALHEPAGSARMLQASHPRPSFQAYGMRMGTLLLRGGRGAHNAGHAHAGRARQQGLVYARWVWLNIQVSWFTVQVHAQCVPQLPAMALWHAQWPYAHGMGQARGGAATARATVLNSRRMPRPNFVGTFAWLLSEIPREEILALFRSGYFRLHAVSRFFANLIIACICGT
jgi:hypothetical protein